MNKTDNKSNNLVHQDNGKDFLEIKKNKPNEENIKKTKRQKVF